MDQDDFTDLCERWGVPDSLVEYLIDLGEKVNWREFDRAPKNNGFRAFIEGLVRTGAIDDDLRRPIFSWWMNGGPDEESSVREYGGERRTLPVPPAPAPRRDHERDQSGRRPVYIAPVRAAHKNKGNPFSWIIDSVDDRLPPNAPDFINGTTVVFGGLALVAILVILMLAFAAFMRGGEGAPQAPGLSGATAMPIDVAPEPWFNQQLASEQNPSVRFDFLKHWDINQIADWMTKTPWSFIAFLFLGPFIIGLMTFQERNAEQESSDVWLVLSGQGAYIVLFAAAEIWSWFGRQYGVDVGTGPAWVHVIAFIVNFSLQFAASFGGDKDWTAVAGHGLFIPGVAMVAWWWNDPLLSGIGIALMLAGLVWECAEVNNSGGNQDKKGGRGGLGALIAAVVMVVVFLITTGLLYFTFGGLPYIPAPDWKVDPVLLKIYAASLAWVFNNRVIVAATFGAMISWGSGVGLATMLIQNVKTGIGPEGKMRVGESSRHDAVVVGVMLTYFVVLGLSFLF